MTEETIALAKRLLDNWDLQYDQIEIVQAYSRSIVWKVLTSDRSKCLKKPKRPLKKVIFSIYAQDYLAKKGALVPGIDITRDGRLFIEEGSFPYVLSDWIEGQHLNEDNREDFNRLIQGLATFHRDSIGYQPPPGIASASKLGRWPAHYTKRCRQMTAWKLLAADEPEDPFSRLYLKDIDYFIEIGQYALKELEASCYRQWVAQMQAQPGLCHQDYGAGNTVLSDNKVWVIDLDTATFDLPIRDLRGLLSSPMESAGGWCEDSFEATIGCYGAINPLSQAQQRVLLIDMLFPHELHELARDRYARKIPVHQDELALVMGFERGKHQQLKGILES